MPWEVRKSLSDEYTMKIQKSTEQTIEDLAVDSFKGAIFGGSSSAIVSLAKNSSHNVLKETEKVLLENKELIAKEAVARSI